MSLQIWLPLNGNLNNQGLSEVTVTNSGATVASNGKIGKCYSFNGNSYIQFPSITVPNNFSISIWGKWTAFNTWSRLIDFGSATSGSGYGFLISNSGASSNMIFSYQCGSGSVNTTIGTITLNTWYNIIATFQGTTIKVYLNGNLINTITSVSSVGGHTFNYNYLGKSNWSADALLSGSLNDFRLYNHCLSAKEVKEISKGLICHYKLDNKGFGNRNLVKGNFNCTSTSSTYTSSGSLSCILTANDFISNKGKTLTLSCEIYSQGEFKNSSTDWRANRFGIHGAFTYSKADGTTSTIYPFASFLNLGRTGKRYSESWTIPNDIVSVNNTLGLAIQTNPNDGFTRPSESNKEVWWLKNVKLEWGSSTSAYSPANEDTLYTSLGLNSTTEEDCSGYGYNGTLSESLPYASGSPRYDGCYYFNSTSKRITLPTINMSGFSNSFSISWWGKAPSYSGLMYWGFSDGNRLNYYSGLYCNTGDSGDNPYYKPNTTTIISTPSVNTWHHFVMVGDGSSNKLYMDGELYGVAKAYRGITGSKVVINGWDSSTQYKTNGYISDLRIYSTALSASDIKELYSTSASIDKNGNMYAYEFKE